MTTPRDVLRACQGLQRTVERSPGVVARGSKPPPVPALEQVVADPDLYKVVHRLFSDGHHARAVEEAFKFLNNLVKARSGLPELDGMKLMQAAFSAHMPVLRLNAGGSVSECDEQLGYMSIFAGRMAGIRNPRAHEHEWEDTEQRALQLLMLADHLTDRVKRSTKS